MHTPRIIEVKQITNEQVAYCLRCCDDHMETTWHTMHVLSPDHAGQLEERKKEIASRHEAIVNWRKANWI
jgi:hypothetical protein